MTTTEEGHPSSGRKLVPGCPGRPPQELRCSFPLVSQPFSSRPHYDPHQKAMITFKRIVLYNSKEICGICETTDGFTQILLQSSEECGAVRGHTSMHVRPTHAAGTCRMGSKSAWSPRSLVFSFTMEACPFLWTAKLPSVSQIVFCLSLLSSWSITVVSTASLVCLQPLPLH